MGVPLAAVVALAAATTVSVRTNKGIFIPGADASAEVLVVARGAAPDARLELAATAGTLSEPRPLGDGRYQATWTPPKDAPPLIAFVTARVMSGDEVELGFVAMAVHGQATVEADVAPRSSAMIDVGGRPFGPFIAGAGGHVRASILAPPRLAEVTLRDGPEERVLPLKLPPVSLLHAAIAGEASLGAGEPPLEVELFMVDGTGYPGWRPAPKLAADLGTATSRGVKAPGVSRWEYEAPASPAEGTATLTAHIPNDPASVVSLKVALRPPRLELETAANAPRTEPGAPPPPEPITLRLSGTEVISGDDGTEIEAEVLIGDRVITPAELDAAQLDSDVGTIIPAAGVRWVIPPTFSGHAEATLRIGFGGATAEAKIALKPGPPAAGITFDAATARGGRPIGGTLTLADAHHNAVSGASLSFRPGVSDVREARPGEYRFTYTPPDPSAPETKQLEVEVAGGLIVPAPPLNVAPSREVSSLLAGLVLTSHCNLGNPAGLTLSVEVAGRLPGGWLELMARGGATKYQDFATTGDRAFVSFDGLGAEVGARPVLHLRRFDLYTSLAAVIRRISVTAIAQGVLSPRVSSVELGASAALGGGFALGPGRLTAEAGFTWLPGRHAITGNLGGVELRAGYLVELL